ncbi:MOSC domain-containing protein [Halorussus litoreus]|uniref:MOSC domain-containing protein n=1 Tax=Halorussus litoreus TaxID=1710536 RepID=UPI000E2845DF|nr:MOSC N-terminal beta barrel domain-containing protein [Halorussus litoreus]
MAEIARITVFPVKGLDGIDVEATEVLDGGTLEYDREFALFDADSEVLNGKRTDRVHELRVDFDPASAELAVEAPDGETRQFDLSEDEDRERAGDWFGEFFGEDLTLRRDASLGFVDRREMGPSVVSTATLETVASWFDGMTVDGARRRLRANVEVAGVEPFWEDRFLGEDAPAFEAGGVRFEGVTPCGRCVVPERDPDTGERLAEFRERFVRKREETFPDWADEEAFDHFYAVMLIARVPEADRGGTVRVGDPVDVSD